MICDTSTPFDIRFRFLGFPCSISVFFWIGALLLSGANLAGPNGVQMLLVWIVALLISIFVHELGHAIAARTFGSHVTEVRLLMLGGVCRYDRQPASRWRRIIISLAGPGAGFLLWGLLKGGDYSFDLVIRAAMASEYLLMFLADLMWINLIWGLFNLLPILPLDGGHISEELCEGAKIPNANITARWIGIGTCAAIVLIGLLHRSGSALPSWLDYIQPGPLGMLWMALFAVQNYQEIQILRAERGWGRGYGDANDEPWR